VTCGTISRGTHTSVTGKSRDVHYPISLRGGEGREARDGVRLRWRRGAVRSSAVCVPASPAGVGPTRSDGDGAGESHWPVGPVLRRCACAARARPPVRAPRGHRRTQVQVQPCYETARRQVSHRESCKSYERSNATRETTDELREADTNTRTTQGPYSRKKL